MKIKRILAIWRREGKAQNTKYKIGYMYKTIWKLPKIWEYLERSYVLNFTF